MSVQAMGYVFEHMPKASAGARLVLLSIANHAKADGTDAWPSFDRMAKEAGLSRRQAIRCVQELDALGVLIVQREAGPPRIGGRPNLYTVVMSGDALSPLPQELSGDVSDKSSDIPYQKVVTPMSPEPSLEPSKNHPLASPNGSARRDSERTKLKDALVSASDYDRELMTPSTWKKVEAAAKEAAEGRFTPGDVFTAAAWFRRHYPRATVTPQGIVGAFPMAGGP